MSDLVRVGMADYKICRSPQYISTLGLGSCVGVVLYDPLLKICGLAHIMLPDSNRINNNQNRMKFADTCLEDLRNEMIHQGANPNRFVAKIAGGARMFAYDSTNEHLNIGGKNIIAAKEFLKQNNIPILAEDVGGFCGRTIEFYPENGELHVKAVGQGTSII